ncbi:MAG: hypothetical protein ACTSPV_19050, partial [Candidatus Hodarchaeales archaeon]
DNIYRHFSVKVSHVAIGNYRKKQKLAKNVSTKVSKPRPEKLGTTVVTKRRPKKARIDTKKLTEFIRVVNCIHVNVHPSHRETLKEIVGSHSVAEVRKWLIETYTETLG